MLPMVKHLNHLGHKLFCMAIALFIITNLTNAQNKFLSFKKDVTNKEAQTSLPERIAQDYTVKSVTVEYGFPGAFVSDKYVESKQYQFLHIEGFGKMGQVGAPALPAKNEIIAMPKGAKGEIQIISSDYIEYEGSGDQYEGVLKTKNLLTKYL